MEKNDDKQITHRRGFLGSIATGAAALGIATLAAPLNLNSAPKIPGDTSDADAWFNQIKGKHRIVFDATEPHEVFPFAWPKVFLLTNAATGTPENESSVVVILRHAAMPFALHSHAWEKYNLGELVKYNDPKTKAPSTRNPFWKPDVGDFSLPGVGNVQIGINDLQASGVMFCVCAMAIQVYSAGIAQKMNLNADDVKNDFLSAVLPGVQVVPSGVWAVGRAQEHGCGYCFVG